MNSLKIQFWFSSDTVVVQQLFGRVTLLARKHDFQTCTFINFYLSSKLRTCSLKKFTQLYLHSQGTDVGFGGRLFEGPTLNGFPVQSQSLTFRRNYSWHVVSVGEYSYFALLCAWAFLCALPRGFTLKWEKKPNQGLLASPMSARKPRGLPFSLWRSPKENVWHCPQET